MVLLGFPAFFCTASPAADKPDGTSALAVSSGGNISRPQEPAGIAIMRRAYPDVAFLASYDSAAGDWRISITVPGADGGEPRHGELYWCEGRMLPADRLADRDDYWSMMYRYAEEVPDPAEFTEEDIARIRMVSSPEHRQNGPSSPQFFYDLLYDCATREQVEEHITQVSFLGKRSNLHARIAGPLARVEEEILAAAETDAEVRDFVETLASADSYNWREISDSGNRSFHSMGIAIDVLPEGWGTKNIYWAWRRDIDPENWMLLPLDRRWMPPARVIEIFEDNGFLWGGKWTIWDNMHFEYRPEVVLYTRSGYAAGN